MANEKLDTIILNHLYGEQRKQGDGSNPINLLLQIILPITLILGIVVFTKVNEYDKLINELQKDPYYDKYQKTLIDLQKQVLIHVLEQTEQEIRSRIGLDLLTQKQIDFIATNYAVNKTVHDDFITISKEIYFNLYRHRKQFEEKIYKEVLNRTEEKLNQMQYVSISLDNKLYKDANNYIIKFIEVFINESVYKEHQIIYGIHRYFYKNFNMLEKWDSKLNNIINDLIHAETEDEIQDYSGDLNQRIYDKIKEDFTTQKAYLLPQIWKKKGLKLGTENETY